MNPVKLTQRLVVSLLLLTLPSIYSHDLFEEDIDGHLIRTTNSEVSNRQWSEWSGWSPCSRSCDGGISTSLRKCLSKSGCDGDRERHKICNMQPCLTENDYRDLQCAAFNSKPYRDRYYEWKAYIDPTDPCSLTCKAKGLNFVAKLASQVKDGTRCRLGSLDMCVAGKCLSVGCDLQLGSIQKVDECGICGGDGQSCKTEHYIWTHRFFSNCSHSCRGGFQHSSVVCLNKNQNKIVDDLFCDLNEKPRPESRECNDYTCLAEWLLEEWSDCNQKCGTGFRTRKVFCGIKHSNGSIAAVGDKYCVEPRPESQSQCNDHQCPQWFDGPWSECSEQCGSGTQTRSVFCKDSLGLPSDLCEIELKPKSQQECSDISRCLNSKSNSQEDSPHSLTNKLSLDPSFVVGEWSHCNVSCGIGVRTRKVECKINLEFSKTVVSIPEGQCPGEKPIEYEVCYKLPCHKPLLISKDMMTNHLLTNNKLTGSKYFWRINGFTDCSRNCLGGTQETLIECVDLVENSTVSSKFCSAETKPDSYTRTCNDQPCIPRWNMSTFSECSKECGQGGFQTRIVKCVQEIARGTINVVVVPDHRCGSPMPSTKQPCNQLDCPSRWITGPWFKCSRECGSGFKTRKIRCMKDYVFGGLREVSPSECSVKKPKILKICNTKPCRPLLHDSSGIELTRKSKRNNNIDYVYKTQDKVTVKVRGKAVVFEGSIVKLRCPESDEVNIGTPLIWLKGHERIEKSKTHFLFRNVLKIKNIKVSDTGVYKCYYNTESIHSMFLLVSKKRESNNSLNLYTKSANNSNYKANVDDSANLFQNELDISQEVEKFSTASTKHANQLPLYLRDKSDNFVSLDKFEDSYEVTKYVPIRDVDRHKEKSTSDNGDKFNESNVLTSLINANYKELQFDWITTDWSKCTIPCGGVGFKMRLSQCYVRFDNITQSIDSSFCTEAGLKKPNNIERCGYQPCFHWKIGKWSDCDNCLETHKALQSRSVDCVHLNKTVLSESHCLEMQTKPPVTQECINKECVAYWFTGKWSKCNASCHEDGLRSRIVQCVWRNTDKPADSSRCQMDMPDSEEQCYNSCDL